MMPFLSVGPLLLQLPLMALLAGVWAGAWLSEKEAARLKLDAAALNNLIFGSLFAGLVGARLAYALRYFEAYAANPLALLAINANSLAGFEGLLVGLAFAFWYARRKGLPLRPTLDALAPGLALFMVALGLAHLLSGDAYGAVTGPATGAAAGAGAADAAGAAGSAPGLPWAITLWGAARHPSQVYEILGALIILAVVMRRPFEPAGAGLNFWLWAALTAGARVFLEAFRGDSLALPGGLRAAQVIGLLVLAASLIILRAWRKPPEVEANPL